METKLAPLTHDVQKHRYKENLGDKKLTLLVKPQ